MRSAFFLHFLIFAHIFLILTYLPPPGRLAPTWNGKLAPPKVEPIPGMENLILCIFSFTVAVIAVIAVMGAVELLAWNGKLGPPLC